MARNWLLAHWKRIAMQASLCGVLLATVGLAGFVVHAKRLALRLPLGQAKQVGRLGTMLPRGWSTPVTSEHNESGDVIQTEEIVPEPLTGRKLSVRRLPVAGWMAPLECLLRAGMLTPKDLTGREPGAKEKTGPVARVQALDVAGWPGVVVSHTVLHLNGRRSLKEIIACSVLPHGQAVVIKLDGVGPPDAGDEELVRQIAEAARVFVAPTGDEKVLPEPSGPLVELGAGVYSAIPEHFTSIAADDRLSRDLLGDGTDGHWTAVELIPCVWLADEPPDKQFLTMLTAHDRTWHSTTVTQEKGKSVWQADRVPLAGEMQFPARGYCITNGQDQAMIAIVRGGWHDAGGFDAAWEGISRNVRFPPNRDVTGMLERGTEGAAALAAVGLNNLFGDKPVAQNWVLWNAAENSDRQDWMTLKVARSESDATAWTGVRTPAAAGPAPLGVGAGGDATYQSWDGAADFSTYSVRTDQAVSVRGETNARRATQRIDLRDGKLINPLASDEPRPVPPQYVPGGWLPMALARVGDKSMILRTESFLAADGSAPPGLLTLVVNRVHGGDAANCVSVTVNGSGRVAKFWYDAAGVMYQIDLGAGLRAQGIDVTAGQ